MPKLEFTRKSELSRQQAAERLITIGRALAAGSEVELSSGGYSVEIEVADHVRWKVEIEVDGDETEIEIEISWRDEPAKEPEPAEPATPTAPAKAARRSRARKQPAK